MEELVEPPGLQEYDVPPEAERTALEELQMSTSGPAFAVGNATIFTLTASVEEHPFASVPVTV